MEPQLIRKEPLGNGTYCYVSERHSFGTDAVLLADFAAPKPRDSLVDLGTGCGIIPLLMLRDGSPSAAVGVEISHEATALASRAAAEQYPDRFSVIESDLRELKGKIDFGCHTLVTCNPPYKAPGAGLKSTDPTVAAARHEISCTLEDVVNTAARLLQTAGRFCVCHRPERLAELVRLMTAAKLEPKRLRLVCQRAGEEPWLVLLEGKKCAAPGMRIASPLFVEENGGWSAEMLRIYGCYKEGHL